MKFRILPLSLASLIVFACTVASAQGLRLPAPAGAGATGNVLADSSKRAADFIVAVVNSEPITNHQVRLETQRVTRQLTQAQQPIPDAREMAALVLERLIVDRSQLHLARESGIKIDETAINEAEQSVARQNQIDVPEVYRRLAADGIERTQFRNQLRDQLMLVRVREREVNQKVRVSERDIDQYLLDQTKNQDPSALEINIAHVLLAMPDEPSAAQVAEAQTKAQRVLERARAGEDFAGLARELSAAPDASSGGQLGLRRAERYPGLFVDAVRSMAVGELSVVRSGAGLHVLKLIDRRSSGMPATSLVQTRAAHILLRVAAQSGEPAALEKLGDLRKRIVAGQTDFATVAKENSQDGSAAQGGDLGWASPGQYVPEFEEVVDALAPGQISEPVISRFGAHLITVRERRTVQLSQREQRELVRAMLREKKLDEAYLVWAQELRARAYVELREPPP